MSLIRYSSTIKGLTNELILFVHDENGSHAAASFSDDILGKELAELCSKFYQTHHRALPDPLICPIVTCGSCSYFKGRVHDGAVLDGECTRNPPLAARKGELATVYPLVDVCQSACGEHKEKGTK